jgi:hypothetical protein
MHPQKFGCTPNNEGKRVHVPPDEKTCGHADKCSLIQYGDEKSHHFFVILYITCQILFFHTELNARLPTYSHDH